MIAIIDYRMGNLRSVQKGFEHAGVADAVVTDDPSVVERADGIVLAWRGRLSRRSRQSARIWLRGGAASPSRRGHAVSRHLSGVAASGRRRLRGWRVGGAGARARHLRAAAARGQDPAHRLEHGRVSARERACSPAYLSRRRSTSFTATVWFRTTRVPSSAPQSTAYASPLPCKRATSTRYSSTPRRARRWGSDCFRTSTTSCTDRARSAPGEKGPQPE